MSGLFRITDANGRWIANPSFEKYEGGRFTGWTPRNSPTVSLSESNVFTGRYSARLQNASTTADRGLYQDVGYGLVSSREYKVTVRVYVAAGTAALSVTDGAGFSNEVRANSSGTGWQRLEVTKTAGGVGIRIALYANTAGADAYFDDVRIATASIDFIEGGGSLFHITNWRQAVAGYKGGGVWQDSPLADGRRPVMRQYANYLEQVEFQISEGASEDATIADLRGLFALMEAAVDYWASDGKTAPVYIEARGRNETNTRYAILYAAEVPELPDPYSIEWQQLVLMDMTLEAEHGDWLSLPPGEGVYVAITTQGPSVRYERTDIPTQSEDDCTVDTGAGSIALANATIELGDGTVGNGGGFRFRTVDIPAGATILSAYVTFESGGASSGKPCILLIQGEAADDAAVFSTYADYAARTRTTNFAVWEIESFSGAGVAYDTPNIAKVIQEIVGRSGWASGNDIAVFIEDTGSAAGVFRLVRSWDHGSAVEPTLHVTYTYPLGQETYVTNKRNEASITHLVNFDASAATATTSSIPAALPFTLFPASPASGDYVVFMSDTVGVSGVNGGPFNNLVFNLTTAAIASGSYTITWEYYNGAWVALTTQDNTEQFSLTGVNSIHFNQPSDWATVTVGGITGYAIRARISALSGLFTRPVQASLDIYTTTWPYVEIDDGIVGGDRPALARLQIYNESDAPDASASPALWANRVIVGLRSLWRGRDFTAYINLSNVQNPAGVTVAVIDDGGTPTFAAGVTKATGRVIDWSPSGVESLIARASVSLDETMARQYAGAYHLYLRARQVNGSVGDISVQVRFRAGGNNFSFISEPKTFEYVADDHLLDFGRVEILPGYQITDIPARAQFYIYASNDSGSGRQVLFYDLILIPADEWMGDYLDWDNSLVSILGRPDTTGDSRYLDADGIHVPRPRAVIRHADSDNIYVNWRQDTPGPPILQKNTAQRLWFLAGRYISPASSDNQIAASIGIGHRVVLYMAQRYKAGRGSS